MTTAQPRLFNPAGTSQQRAPSLKEREKKEYPTTGNITRDQVRKILFEAFDPEEGKITGAQFSVSEIVDQIENDIF